MLKGAGMLILGALLGYAAQERERAGDRVILAAVWADADSLRASNKTLRNQCPARVRFQRGLLQFTPGGKV